MPAIGMARGLFPASWAGSIAATRVLLRLARHAYAPDCKSLLVCLILGKPELLNCAEDRFRPSCSCAVLSRLDGWPLVAYL